jgi:major membrane immunogen (membrane-anchored lipoprotein)
MGIPVIVDLGFSHVRALLMKFLVILIVSATGLLSGVILAPLGSAASSGSASIGYDVSYPQCGRTLPASAGFGIVGVNDGHPYTTNPCLASEVSWASTTTSGVPSFYMNTDSPGPADTSNWPTSATTPKACSGANSSACSYDYGWGAAQNSFANAISAETTDGSSSPTTAVTSAHWWLDVETGNHWESIESAYGPSAASLIIDQEMLSGAVAYLTSVGVTNLGIYSTAQQWNTITGTPSTLFKTIPVWMPGYATLAAAEAACALNSFTGGRVAEIQYPSNGLDGDYVCGLVTTPGAASISVAASSTFTQQLSVSGASSAVTYTQLTGSPSLTVSSTGLLSTSGALAPGTYSATGSTSDTNGDAGLFSFILSVGVITQVAPLTVTLKTTQTPTYSVQLVVDGASGAATFAQLTGMPSLAVSSTGLLTTDGALPYGTYSASGTTSDGAGDAGTFHFTMSVGSITQNIPTTASVLTSATPTYSVQLSVSHNDGAVTYTQLTGAPNLVVSSTGLITTDSATLPQGTYKVTGTTTDPYGDEGTFVFTLTVGPDSVTVPPPVIVGPEANYVVGHAVAGRTVTLQIIGSGFYGRPTVTSHAGTTALVVGDTGTALTVRVSVKLRSRNGVFTFTVTLLNGKTATVRYNQH